MKELVDQPAQVVVDEQAMQVLGKQLCERLPESALITLSGDLGAGKSVLVRSMIHALGYEGRVKSPTYTLIELYEANASDGRSWRIAHLDLYRLVDPEELDYLGVDEVLSEQNLVLIEWPEQAGDRLPAADLHITINYRKDGGREVVFSRDARNQPRRP